jgi:hypothetical protein
LTGFPILGALGLCTANACSDSSVDHNRSGSEDGGAAGLATGGSQLAPTEDAGGSDNAEAQGGAGGAERCGETELKSTKRQVNILLLIDRSASMDAPPEDAVTAVGGAGGTTGASEGQGGVAGSANAAEPTKWDLLKQQLVSSLDAVKDELHFGMELFPYAEGVDLDEFPCQMPDEPTVQVPIAPGDEALPEIESVLDDTSPGGNTPISVALEYALSYYTTGDGAALEGDKYVLLATDGGPNCNSEASCGADRCIQNLAGQECTWVEDGNCCAELPEYCIDDGPTIEAIEALAEEGIGTFILGIPGSELYADYLDQFADAGLQGRTGADEHYFKVEAAGNMEGLSEVLSSITGELVKTCILELDPAPPDSGRVNVYIDGEVVPKEGDDGWGIFMGTDPPHIELKGATCTRMMTEGADRVSVEYGCPTVVVL